MMTMLIPLLIAFLVSFILTPLVTGLAIKRGYTDCRDKPETTGTPILGGIAIYLGFAIAIAIGIPVHPGLQLEHIADTSLSWRAICNLVLVSGFLMTFTGFIDDKYELLPLVKLLLHSAVVLVTGILFVINGAQVRLFLEVIHIAWLAVPLTLVWLLGITNSINLLDHADGITAGIAVISAFFFAVLNVMHGNPAVAFISFALAGASLGFLFYNFPPASIYMGDCGSNFLGFMLGIIAILGIYTSHGSIPYLAILSPLLILAVPIIDTVAVVIYRKKHGYSLLARDKNHLTHRLMRMGYSSRTAAAILYLFSIILGTIALLLPTLQPYQVILAFVSAIGIISLFTILITRNRKGDS